jgi:hypothetical protein
MKENKLLLAALAMAPLSAFAAVDVTAITGVATDVATVGAAVFGIYVAVKAIKLIRKAL